MGKVLTCLPVLLAVACGAYAQEPPSPDDRVEVVLDGDSSPAIALGRVDVADIDIEIDGGVSADTIGECAAAGANVFVSGSALFRYDDKAAGVEELKAKAAAARG